MSRPKLSRFEIWDSSRDELVMSFIADLHTCPISRHLLDLIELFINKSNRDFYTVLKYNGKDAAPVVIDKMCDVWYD